MYINKLYHLYTIPFFSCLWGTFITKIMPPLGVTHQSWLCFHDQETPGQTKTNWVY